MNQRAAAGRLRREAASLLCGLALFTVASSARGEAAEALAAGRRLVVSFEYDAALEQLEAVSRDSTASAAQRIEALELMGALNHSLRREARARQLFEQLLTLDPGHELTDTSYPPRLQQFYASIRGSFMPQPGVEVEARAVPDPNDPTRLRLEATLSGDLAGVDRAIAFVRNPGETNFLRAVMRREGDHLSAEIPLPEGGGPLDYYLEVQAPSGHALARVGAPLAPSRYEPQVVAASDSSVGQAEVASAGGGEGASDQGEVDGSSRGGRRAFYRSWWFWTIIGAVVVGVAVPTAVVLPRTPELEPGTLGARSLP